MSNPSYIKENQEELFDNAPASIQDLIVNGDVNKTTAILGQNYKIPVADQVELSNLISFILIGAIQPEDVGQALEEMVHVDKDAAFQIANDLEHGILEKARISLFKPSSTPVATLEFKGQKSKDELRKEIMDTTKRESGLNKNQAGQTEKKPLVITPGSRSQLLEQLQILSTIPNDEEITGRLEHIQEQIAALKKQEEDNSLESPIALKSFMFGEKGKTVAEASIRPATYSVTPTQYNVDPYRELPDDTY